MVAKNRNERAAKRLVDEAAFRKRYDRFVQAALSNANLPITAGNAARDACDVADAALAEIENRHRARMGLK